MQMMTSDSSCRVSGSNGVGGGESLAAMNLSASDLSLNLRKACRLSRTA